MDAALGIAAGDGDARKVEELLSQGARVDFSFRGLTPLLAAAQFGHTEVCKLLLEKGKANIEETGPEGTALITAATNGHSSTVALLLPKGARVDAREQGFTPLLVAAQRGHTEVCKLLLETGKANVKETTPDGFTPLLSAAQKGHTEVCELLLGNGSDLEESSPVTQMTALHYAAGNGHESLLQMLLSHKPDLNIRNRFESTPLLLASQGGHLGCVKKLLQAGADPLLPDEDGFLPIHDAAYQNHDEVVLILIKEGGCSPEQVRHCTAIN